MDYQIDKIFVPGKGVELVFNLDSLSPLSRHSMIFDSDTKKKELIISQTTPKVMKTFSYDTLHLTALKMTGQNEKVRVGLQCQIEKFISSYELNRETSEEAILVKYQNKITEVNIRSAYRIKPNNIYSIIAKLEYNNKEYYSGKHYKIFDISLSGIGILAPNIQDRKKNPLMYMEPGEKAQIGIVIKEPGSDNSGAEIKKLFNELKVVRVNRKFNQRYVLIGCRFSGWEMEEEEELSKFIHELQLHEIRHFQQF